MDERTIQVMAHDAIKLYGDNALDRIDDCINEALERDDEQSGILMCRLYDVILA
jgi:hypothetical protein